MMSFTASWVNFLALIVIMRWSELVQPTTPCQVPVTWTSGEIPEMSPPPSSNCLCFLVVTGLSPSLFLLRLESYNICSNLVHSYYSNSITCFVVAEVKKDSFSSIDEIYTHEPCIVNHGMVRIACSY